MSKKECIVCIRFSPEDLKQVRAKAEILHMTSSRYIRTMVLEGEVYQLETPEYRNVMLEMNRIGVNFNQITRRLNEQGSFYYEDMNNIKEEHEKLCRMLSQYLSTLRLKKV